MVCFQVFSSIPVEFYQNESTQSEINVEGGKVLIAKIYSQAVANNKLGNSGDQKVSVYLPPGYGENVLNKYPVIYFLSGEHGTSADWFSLSEEHSFTEILNRLTLSGNIKPMIMVFPDSRNKITKSWFTNSSVTGNWEDFIINDVVTYIDNNFRTVPFAACRGITGLSAGGYGALKLATKHPDVFSAVYSINALIDFETVVNDTIIWKKSFETAAQAEQFPTSDAFANNLLSMALNFTPDENNPSGLGMLPKTASGDIVASVYQKWLEEDPKFMIKEHFSHLKSLKAITVDCSTSNTDIMLNYNYSNTLNSYRIKHTFRHFDGNDNNVLLSRVTNFLLPMFSENLAHSLLNCEIRPCYTFSDKLVSTMITDGSIYIVPVEMDLKEISLKSGQSLKINVKANQKNEIPLANLEKGIYRIFGVSNTGFNGEPLTFGLNGGTPQVKICVTDSYTGSKINTCQMTVNEIVCHPDENGDHCFNAEGELTICMKKENYGELIKNATIYTDTTLNISLIKDSYIQVIEKGYGMPVFEATVTQNGTASLTSSSGFVTVKNVKDGMLDCRIFKNRYFTEVVHTELKPGRTVIVELTKKKANVDFYVSLENGPAQWISVDLGEFNAFTDVNGKASFTGIDTRAEYTYSIQNENYEWISYSFTLTADTIINVYLQPKEMEIPLKESNIGQKNDLLFTGSSEMLNSEIMVYPNPATTEVTVKTNGKEAYTIELLTLNGTLLYKSKAMETLHRINLSNLSNGVYFVTVKSNNFHHTQKIMKL